MRQQVDKRLLPDENDGSRNRTNFRQDRTARAAKDFYTPVMREDIGVPLNQPDYDNASGILGKISDAKTTYKRETDSLIGQAKNKIKTAFNDENLVTIRVVNGNSIEGEYKLPKEAIDKLNAEIFNQGDGSYVGNYKSDNIYNVDVVPRGTSDAYGKELHEAIGKAVEDYQGIVATERQAVEKELAGAQKAQGIQLEGFDKQAETLTGEWKQQWDDRKKANAIAVQNLVDKGVLQGEVK